MPNTHDTPKITRFFSVKNEASIYDKIEVTGDRLPLMVDELSRPQFEQVSILDHVFEPVHR